MTWLVRPNFGVCVCGPLAAIVSATGAQPPASPEPSREPDPPVVAIPLEKQRVGHLKLTGDLDHMKLARQFGDELAAFKRDGVELFVLELNGDRWRADVVSEMIRTASTGGIGSRSGAGGAMGVPWIVWLCDPVDNRVGTGQAALAAVADRCYLGPKTEIVFEPGNDARSLAPPGTPTQPGVNWDQIDQDLQAAVWARLQSRSCDMLLASVLPTPRQPLWIIGVSGGGAGGPSLKLVAAEPGTAGGTRAPALVWPAPGGESGAMRLRMEASAAVGLGLAAGQAKELGQILAARRIAPRPVIRHELQSGLAGARERLDRDLSAIDAARERLDKSLDEAERLRGHDATKRRSQAGADAVALADEASRKLLAAEALTGEYPELLRGPPPGQTSIGLTDARLGFAWNTAFQTRREALTELRNRAARLIP